MEYTFYEILWFFVIYSIVGWCGGVAVAAFRKKAFVNTGFLNAPFCPIYGFGAVAFSFFLPELNHRLFFLFLGGMIIAAFLTFVTGFLLERIYHRRWWDFTKSRFQFEGYISFPYLAAFGLSAIICIRLTNPLIINLLDLLPLWLGKIILIVIYVLFAIDFSGSAAVMLRLRSRVKQFSEVTDNLQKVSFSFGSAITNRIQRRMMKAYPNLKVEKLQEAKETAASKVKDVFAEGCCFYKLVGLFFLGSFLGDVVETIFCYLTTGVIMSRSSVVYGPFSIVWGLGCAMLTAFLYKYKDKSDRYIFISGTVLGGAYEYICSVFTERVFGTIFWDYSELPFNLGGRINLLYCFFWGVAALVWLKGVYPVLSNMIERIPKRAGTAGTWILIVFMVVNMGISGLALARYSTRQTAEVSSQGTPDRDIAGGEMTGKNAISLFLDEHFPDSRMERIYPNAKVVD